MIILNRYSIRYQNINDEFIVASPEEDFEMIEMFKFRYEHYLKHDYIFDNDSKLDIDDYDNKEEVYYINVYSSKQNNRIIGSVRIIYSEPLPILKDCFYFKEPYFIKLFNRGKLAEISRLIVDKYGENVYLPRHFIMIIIIKEIFNFSKDNNIYFIYSFVKLSLLKKLNKIHFPFLRIGIYKQKYKGGVLGRYFNQIENPVIPIYFYRPLVKIYLFFIFFRFKKYIVC